MVDAICGQGNAARIGGRNGSLNCLAFSANLLSMWDDSDEGPFVIAHLRDFAWADTNHDAKPDVVTTPNP